MNANFGTFKKLKTPLFLQFHAFVVGVVPTLVDFDTLIEIFITH